MSRTGMRSPTRLVLSQPPQRCHVDLLVDDVPLQDLRDDNVRHVPEPIVPQWGDNPRDQVKRDVRPGPPDSVDDHCQRVS